MNDKPVILLVEDSPDAASEFRDEIKKQIDLQVIVAAPPTNLLELPLLISTHHANAVILDHILQEHSDVTYMGIDAYELLRNAIPSLPLYPSPRITCLSRPSFLFLPLSPLLFPFLPLLFSKAFFTVVLVHHLPKGEKERGRQTAAIN